MIVRGDGGRRRHPVVEAAVLVEGLPSPPSTLDLTDYSLRSRIAEWSLKEFRRHDI